MKSFDDQAQLLCIELVKYSKALRGYLIDGKSYRIATALGRIIPILFDTSVLEHQWLRSD